ncbi:MAG: arsenic-transporting ATPase [Chloroflexi bacterium]|nr:MAG: arsenic-transporting ATPase [Chloroflexota bacterium]
MKTQFIFFSGKGGVGKTSMACATALRHADEGRRTLIVTTDPAANLSDVFEQSIGHNITPITGAPNLWAMEIDPDRATEEYIDRAMAPIRAAFPPQMVQVMEEQMSGPCTAEVAAFDRFVDFLDLSGNGNGQPARFEVVIFDTAPTGHTLRLIELPAEWSRSIAEAEQGSGQTCIGPAAAIQEARFKYERAMQTMRDEAQTTFVFVLQPEATSIKETRRAIAELDKLGIHTYRLIINGIIPPAEAANPLLAARIQMQTGYLAQIERDLPLPARRMFLLDSEIKGLKRLRDVAKGLFDGQFETTTAPAPDSAPPAPTFQPLAAPPEAFARLLPNGQRRVLFFAGKGGVGKTVASCLTAVWLARQGCKTLLLTTDPAAHLGDVLGVPVGDQPAPVEAIPDLWAAKIDPKTAAEAYKQRILDDARRRGRPPEAIAVMEEELNSPCTEEMAAFDRFIDYATQDTWQVIVFDTAPTGHTLRLLELPVDWSKQLDVKVFASVDTTAADDVAKQRFGQVIEMMRDPNQSTFAFVMYPESTPIIEAYRAAEELRTVGIEPGLVVANFIIPPEQATTPFVRARRAMQEKYLAEISHRFPVPVVQIPLLPNEVSGLEHLIELGKRVFNGAGEPEARRI